MDCPRAGVADDGNADSDVADKRERRRSAEFGGPGTRSGTELRKATQFVNYPVAPATSVFSSKSLTCLMITSSEITDVIGSLNLKSSRASFSNKL